MGLKQLPLIREQTEWPERDCPRRAAADLTVSFRHMLIYMSYLHIGTEGRLGMGSKRARTFCRMRMSIAHSCGLDHDVPPFSSRSLQAKRMDASKSSSLNGLT